jgi:dihydroorotase
MKILVRQALIKDNNSSHNNTVKDILVSDGIIADISSSIDVKADHVLEAKGKMISPGWVDVFTVGTDPGYEFKDDLHSLANSAASGGFTHVFSSPNTQPIVQSKTGVEYIVSASKTLPCRVHPIGAVTKNTEGKELTEMYDMHASGSIGFGDGVKSIQSAGLLIKALQYVSAFNGIVIQVPDDHSVAPHGQMNEGIISTQIGLPGKPALAEEIMVARDLALAAYTHSRIHITGVSLASSVAMIKKAKKDGVHVTCSATVHHLLFTENDLIGYNTNLKLNPPLRTEKDRKALIQGIKDGTIDCISSHHTAQNKDAKVCEFEYAGYGTLGLEAAFGMLGKTGLSTDEIIQSICINPRTIFHLLSSIEKNQPADMTIFDEDTKGVFSADDIKSKSANAAFLGFEYKGSAMATILHNKYYKK